MERTGHRSLEGVRSYKRTSNEQWETLSDILNNEVPRIDKHLAVAEVQDQLLQVYGEKSVSSPIRQENQLTSSQVDATCNTNVQTEYSLPVSFTFNSCPSVTANIDYQ